MHGVVLCILVYMDATSRSTRKPRGAISGGRPSGAELVLTRIREQIISGERAPGSRLFELEVANELAVSRTPVREALHMLQAEGLVDRLAMGGVVVASLNLRDAQELYAVRAVIEGQVAFEACQKVTDDDVEDLRRYLDQMRRLTDYEDELLRLGKAFHERVQAIAANHWCSTFMGQLRGHIDRYRPMTTQNPQRRRDLIEEHTLILDALLSGDPELARSTMQRHVQTGGQECVSAVAAAQQQRRDADGAGE